MTTKETERKTAPSSVGRKSAASKPRKSSVGGSRKPAAAGNRKTAADQRPAQKAPLTQKQAESVKKRPGAGVKEPEVAEKKQARPAQEIVYLPPKPFQRNRLIMQLLTVVAVVLALVLGISVFFKVDKEKTQISGCDKYTPEDILTASGIKDGDHLLTFSRTKIAGRIISALPYVDEVRIGIQLPDTVTIQISEVKVLYGIKAETDNWWLISAGGKVVEASDEGAQSGYTKILGVRLDHPKVGDQGVALEDQQPELDEEGNPLPITVSQAMRLNTALDIISHLELNGILGKVDSIDVNDLGNIQLWYGQQYQVRLGSDSQLKFKISCLKSAVDQLDSYQSGLLDISFTTWPDQVGYTPFTSGETAILPNN